MTPTNRMMARARGIARTLALPTARPSMPADAWTAQAARFNARSQVGDAVPLRTSRRFSRLFDGYSRPAQVIPQPAALANVDTSSTGLEMIRTRHVPSRTVPAPIP